MALNLAGAQHGPVSSRVSVSDDHNFEFFAQCNAQGGIDAEVRGKPG
jgi:hypothetical protein